MAAPKRLLVVTVTKGFRHDSIPAAERVLQQLSEQNRAFTVDFARTDDELRAKTTEQALAGYDGVVFANTSGDLPLADREAFLKWIQAGHGFVGFHAPSDTFPGFPAYIEMLGGQFGHHGPNHVRVQCSGEDTAEPPTKHLGKRLAAYDEIYHIKNFNRSAVHMLLSLDKNPETGEAGYFPLAWSRDYGKGRVFYTALGHRDDVIESDWFRRHLLGGIQWALGEGKK